MRRRLCEPAGFSSLFKYCRAVLRLSEDAVYNRIESARAARRYQVIVEKLLARRFPKADVTASVRKLPVGKWIAVVVEAQGGSAPLTVASEGPALPIAPVTSSGAWSPSVVLATVPPRAVVRPLAPERYAIHFTATVETREKLRSPGRRIADRSRLRPPCGGRQADGGEHPVALSHPQRP
jgi:hypothetical protein